MASGSKSVLVAVFGPSFSRNEDAVNSKLGEAAASPIGNESVGSAGNQKSLLRAIFGPTYSAAPDRLQLGPQSSTSTSSAHEEASTSELKRPPAETSVPGVVRDRPITRSVTDGFTEDSTPVEELVSSFESQCKEVLEITEPIPMTQRLESLQVEMRKLSKRLGDEVVPRTTGHRYAGRAGRDSSQYPQKLLTNWTETKVVSVEQFDAFRNDVMEYLKSIENFQKQVHQRIVPRIILCSKPDKRWKRKRELIHNLAGLKKVMLDILCEQKDKEHKVDGMPGCELNLKKGDSWDAIYPFLFHGLWVFQAVTNMGLKASGMGDMVPSAHCWLQQFNAKVVPHDLISKKQTYQADARQGAEQWLVNHLKKTDISLSFGLQRMMFEKSGGSQPKGTVIWLCKHHAERGQDSDFLSYLPTDR